MRALVDVIEQLQPDIVVLQVCSTLGQHAARPCLAHARAKPCCPPDRQEVTFVNRQLLTAQPAFSDPYIWADPPPWAYKVNAWLLWLSNAAAVPGLPPVRIAAGTTRAIPLPQLNG